MKRQDVNQIKAAILITLVILAVIGYLTLNVNPKYVEFAMRLRVPKLLVMLVTAFCIGGASIVFQTLIQNTIVTPCLLGMNSLYTLIHTAVVFCVGSGSVLAANANAAFAIDLVLMGITATLIYSYLFKKTKHNVLYVLLVGTVLTSFFSSVQSTMTRVMDPNEYDTLLTTLVASFSNVNAEIIIFALAVLAAVIFFLRRELALLDVLTLGKAQAISLGVDYDRCIRRLLLGVTLAIAVATAMVENRLGISLDYELSLRRTPHRIVARDLEHPAHRDIRIACSRHRKSSLVVRTFLDFATNGTAWL